MSNVNEETSMIIESLKSILVVPAENRNSQYDPKTSEAIRQTIRALEQFIRDDTPNGFTALNDLLSNIIIRYSGDIKSNKEFEVEKELSYTLKGKSGEHFVAAELFREKYHSGTSPAKHALVRPYCYISGRSKNTICSSENNHR